MMVRFRENPPEALDGSRIVQIDDYSSSLSLNIETGNQTSIDLPKSNVLIFSTEEGTRLAARPSGTEPKIKFYMSANAPMDKPSDYDAVKAELEAKFDRILSELKLDA